MEKNELFKKVFIKSEADLPKEKAWYFATTKGGIQQAYYYPHTEYLKKQWLTDIDWYLQPIEQPSQQEEIIKALTGEAIVDVPTVTSTTYEQPERQSAEEVLKSIFADLWDNAYDPEYHHYEYKPSNQIIRKHFESYMRQGITEITDEEIDLYFNDCPDNKIHPERYRAEGAKWYREQKRQFTSQRQVTLDQYTYDEMSSFIKNVKARKDSKTKPK